MDAFDNKDAGKEGRAGIKRQSTVDVALEFDESSEESKARGQIHERMNT